MKITALSRSSLSLIIPALLMFTACKEVKKDQSSEEPVISEKPEAQTVEVLTNAMDFVLDKKVLQPGWTTFNYKNNSEEPHFFIFEKMPDSIRLEHYKNELIPVYLNAFQFMLDGNIEAGMKEFEKTPEWFSKVKLGGGVGLTSARTESSSTIWLEPGIYVMECYVRMPNGLAHTFMGMVAEIEVKGEVHEGSEPETNMEITLSSEEGIRFKDSIPSGAYTMGVTFKDQKLYETTLGHDVNLVRLENEKALDSLDKWINAADLAQFRSPAPQGITFLGGVEDLEGGSKGYMHASLSPGLYVLISEIPSPVARNMYKIFRVYP